MSKIVWNRTEESTPENKRYVLVYGGKHYGYRVAWFGKQGWYMPIHEQDVRLPDPEFWAALPETVQMEVPVNRRDE